MKFAKVFPKPINLFLILCGALFLSIGCSRKETVLDVETPAGEVEVTRDKSNGNVDVDVNEN